MGTWSSSARKQRTELATEHAQQRAITVNNVVLECRKSVHTGKDHKGPGQVLVHQAGDILLIGDTGQAGRHLKQTEDFDATAIGSGNQVTGNHQHEQPQIQKTMAQFEPGHLHIERHALTPDDVSYNVHLDYEVFTDPHDGSGGIIAELTVYKRDAKGERKKIQTYPVAAGLSSSEFGNITSAGLYDFEYVFTDLSYRGVVRVGILLGQFTEL